LTYIKELLRMIIWLTGSIDSVLKIDTVESLVKSAVALPPCPPSLCGNGVGI